MATVVSLTEEKIRELLAGWEGVELSQDELNALVTQLWVNNETQDALLTEFNEVTLPAVQADVSESSIQVSALTDMIPDLELQLDQHQLSIDNINTAVLPPLQTELASANNWILELNEVTLPELYSQLDANNVLITDFNTVTLPVLNARLDTAEANIAAIDLTGLQADLDAAETAINNLNTVTLPALDTRLDTAEGEVSALEGKFPITGPDIAADAITANKIAADAITAREIAANAITAAEIAADTITAAQIAADAITANEIAANAVTAAEIAADAVTAGKIAADAITAREIQADSITASEIAGRTITANEIATDAITANEIAADTITANEIATDTITANEIAADTITANEIAADTITANEIATDAITANEIAGDTITANEIAAGAITTTELATGSVTALKIQGGTITGDKIAADTIAVTKLIVSDMTNLIPDGDLQDPTLATWQNSASMTRVNPVGGMPYLEHTTGDTHRFFRNEHTFEVQPEDSFYIQVEVETPATNTTDVKFYPAVEMYDADDTSLLWKAIDTGVVIMAPGSGWTVIQGVLTIEHQDARRLRFNAYLDPTTGTQQKFRIRKMSLRKRSGGKMIVDGSITAEQLDVSSVTTAILNAGLIQSQLNITGMLAIEGANMGWSAEEGLWLGDDVVFYGDERTNRIEGDLVTESISIKTGLSIGGDADIHGTLVSANGITTPTGKMSLGQTWPKILGSAPSNSLGDGESDQSQIFQGILDWNATQWLIPFNYFGAGFRKVNKSDLYWAGDLTVGSWASEFYPHGGICQVGTSMYILGSDGKRNYGDFYIYKLDMAGTIRKEAEIRVGPSGVFGGKHPRLVSNGTNVGMIWAGKTSGDLTLRWYNPGLTARVGSDVVLMAGVGNVHVGDAYLGPAQPGGTSRLWVSLQQGDSNMVRCYTTAGARVASEDFPRASGSSLIGLSYDTAAERMKHLDKYGTMYTYSKYVDGGTVNAQYTLYDGDNSVYPTGTIINGVDVSGTPSGTHETAPSPVTSYTLSKRAWPTITAPPAPDELVTDVTQVDKADRLGIYAAVGGTARLQAYLAKGVRTLPLTDELSLSGALAGASTVPSFATAMVPPPGRMRSGAVDSLDQPIWDLLGSGLGKMGPYKWDAAGKPLNWGVYSTTTTQNIPASVWTARTGWAHQGLTGHGISYANGVFTVAQAGLWHIQGSASLNNQAQAGGRRMVVIEINGVDVFRQELQAGTTNSINVNPTTGGVVYVPAGAAIRVMVYHNYSASLPGLGWDGTNHFSAVCLAAF